MREGIFQRKGNVLVPYDPESAEVLKEYYENQPLRVKITGTKKPRSYRQLRAYWKACEIVAENSEEMQDKYDVDWNVRVSLRHYDRMVVQGNKVIVECKSISFSNLDHAEANRFFDRAFELMAGWLGVSTSELLNQAEL